MARISIESKWWTDPRRKKLARILDSEIVADGLMVSVWIIAQQYRGRGNGLIPIHVWETVEACSSIVECNLAVVTTDGVYARGSQEYLDWVVAKRQSAAEGGRRSAASRKAKNGTAQPRTKTPKQNRSTCFEDASSTTRYDADDLSISRSKPEPSGSGSVLEEEAEKPKPAKPTRPTPTPAHSVEEFQARFDPQAERYRNGLKDMGIEPAIRSNLSLVLQRFAEFDEFKEWANGLLDAADKKSFETERDRIRYLVAATKKEIGAIA